MRLVNPCLLSSKFRPHFAFTSLVERAHGGKKESGALSNFSCRGEVGVHSTLRAVPPVLQRFLVCHAVGHPSWEQEQSQS